MRLAMGRSGRIQRRTLLLLLVVAVIAVGVSGKPQQGAAAGGGDEAEDGDYTEYPEYPYENEYPEYDEGKLHTPPSKKKNSQNPLIICEWRQQVGNCLSLNVFIICSNVFRLIYDQQ